MGRLVWGLSQRPYGALWICGALTQGFTLGYFHILPTGRIGGWGVRGLPPISRWDCEMDGAPEGIWPVYGWATCRRMGTCALVAGQRGIHQSFVLSPVPKSEGPGAPPSWFGKIFETEATRQTNGEGAHSAFSLVSSVGWRDFGCCCSSISHGLKWFVVPRVLPSYACLSIRRRGLGNLLCRLT